MHLKKFHNYYVVYNFIHVYLDKYCFCIGFMCVFFFLNSSMNSSSMNSHHKAEQPDPDAIKMFVGQIPRSKDEDDLRKMFEEFGDVFQLNVLRDKATGQSKGKIILTWFLHYTVCSC